MTLIEEYAKVNLNNNKLHLNSGTTCKFSDEHCIDTEAGHAFWSHVCNMRYRKQHHLSQMTCSRYISWIQRHLEVFAFGPGELLGVTLNSFSFARCPWIGEHRSRFQPHVTPFQNRGRHLDGFKYYSDRSLHQGLRWYSTRARKNLLLRQIDIASMEHVRQI